MWYRKIWLSNRKCYLPVGNHRLFDSFASRRNYQVSPCEGAFPRRRCAALESNSAQRRQTRNGGLSVHRKVVSWFADTQISPKAFMSNILIGTSHTAFHFMSNVQLLAII
ncbi:hypothetical protein PILCRDRAFT_312853 [Piloderma croceum F 1598]|uniref:Uncharacterized protein n=1 Tax=Piloderma croceum (strain F 1598) TaxID=765440 RepID=A0A0C3G7R3_PILCF|nr:hypothetical protein PILCRDRAFT_312853 [Piloderma croceum F 1598]